MSKAILSELKLLRAAVVRLIGSSGLPEDTQLSPEVLDKAGEDFKRLQSMSDLWFVSHDLIEYFKIEDPRHNVGSFIIEHFRFTNYFKYKRTYYFNKADIRSLAIELKARNVNLSRYIDFKSEEGQFIEKIQIASKTKKANKDMPYWLSDIVRDVENKQPPRPTIEIVKSAIDQLRNEFLQFKLNRYIDVYQGDYAMVKFEFRLKKYIDSDIKKRSERWCLNYNYALRAIQILDERKAKLLDIIDHDDLIEL